MSTVLRCVNMDMLTGSSNCLLPRNFNKAKAPSRCLEAGVGEVSSLIMFSKRSRNNTVSKTVSFFAVSWEWRALLVSDKAEQ